jgi:uncharacterized cupin superfamily protein
MPIHVRPNVLQAVALTPYKNGIAFAEILGRNENENKKPVTCGLFSIDGGEATAFKYPFDTFSYILDGEFRLEDAARPGEFIELNVGDVVHIEEGSTAKWSSPTKGKCFYVALKHLDHQPDLIVTF